MTSSVPSVIVVGGGLIGVTTAYECARRGLRTTLVEAREGVALETSRANGAMLTPSMSDPWNAPGVHRHLASSLFDPGAAMKLRLRAIPSLIGWGFRFLANSTRERHRKATRASFLLGRYSVERTRALRQTLNLSYDSSTFGTMKLFRSEADMAGPLELAQELRQLGLRFDVLDRQRTIAEEPALAPIAERIFGALRFLDDESGDPHAFCTGLLGAFLDLGGEVRFGAPVRALAVERDRIVGVRLHDCTLTADAVVVAAGGQSVALLRTAGMRLPIQPAKGYSLTFENMPEDGPRLPIIDEGLHAAVVPLGRRLRIAGTAEFAGNDRRIHPDRIDNLRRLLAAIYPQLAARLDSSTAAAWTGARPMSADGLPFIGPMMRPGLFVNTGHGHLGWTLAAGSAHLAAEAVAGATSEIDAHPYYPALSRGCR